LDMGFLDHIKRISKRAANGGIRAIDDFPHLDPQSLIKKALF
jgi:hypothetical protein